MAPPSMSGRAWRPVDDLEHPDEEAIAADHADSDDRPDAEGENEEGDQLPAPAGARDLRTYLF